MTLDEAINDPKEGYEIKVWLRELRRARMEIDLLKTLRDGFKADAQMYMSENAKLRELVRKYGEYTSQDRCEGCVCKSRCNDGEIEECWQLTEIRGLARELGVEVDE